MLIWNQLRKVTNFKKKELETQNDIIIVDTGFLSMSFNFLAISKFLSRLNFRKKYVLFFIPTNYYQENSGSYHHQMALKQGLKFKSFINLSKGSVPPRVNGKWPYKL